MEIKNQKKLKKKLDGIKRKKMFGDKLQYRKNKINK